MNDKLSQIHLLEKEGKTRREGSKRRYEEILTRYREEANQDIAKLNRSLELERTAKMEATEKEIEIIVESFIENRNRELTNVREQFSRHSLEVKQLLIEEVFSGGHR